LQTVNFTRGQWSQKLQSLGLGIKNLNKSQLVLDGNFYICSIHTNTDVNLTDVIPLICANSSMEQRPFGKANRSSARQEIARILWFPAFVIEKRKARHLSLS